MCFDGIAAACHSLRFSVATKRSSLTILLTPLLFFLAFAAICCLLRQRLAQVQLSHRVLPIAARKDKRRWPDSVKHVRSGAPMASCCERAASRSGAAASGTGRRPPCESIDRHRLHGWACRSWQRQAIGAEHTVPGRGPGPYRSASPVRSKIGHNRVNFIPVTGERNFRGARCGDCDMRSCYHVACAFESTTPCLYRYPAEKGACPRHQRDQDRERHSVPVQLHLNRPGVHEAIRIRLGTMRCFPMSRVVLADQRPRQS
jgi:hypothetical protein